MKNFSKIIFLFVTLLSINNVVAQNALGLGLIPEQKTISEQRKQIVLNDATKPKTVLIDVPDNCQGLSLIIACSIVQNSLTIEIEDPNKKSIANFTMENISSTSETGTVSTYHLNTNSKKRNYSYNLASKSEDGYIEKTSGNISKKISSPINGKWRIILAPNGKTKGDVEINWMITK